MRFRARLFAVVFAPSIVLAWSCATDPALDPLAEVDPSIPEVDASWRPAPEPPSDEQPPIERPRAVPDAAVEASPPAIAPPSSLRALPGELFITEVMYDPTGPEPASEWFEVYNAATAARSLAGMTLRDGADRTHTIAGELVVAAGAYAVLARNRDAAMMAGVPASALAYEYGTGASDAQGVLLANGGSGAIAIVDGATELARVEYGAFAFADASGRSAQRDAADAGTWCSAEATPGAANVCATP